MTNKKEKPKHLGRGLKALLGPINLADEAEEGISSVKRELEAAPATQNILNSQEQGKMVKDLAVDRITPNPYQPRTEWNTEKLEELAQSIRANGVIQPILVRNVAGGYELIAGERRLRAAQMAGLDKIPALVKQATDEQMLEIALVENIHRADLNAIERAKAYHKYIESFAITQTEAAERLGENRSVVANYMRLLDLPEDIKAMVASGRLSMGHARAILALPNDDLRRKIANRAMAGRLSVREVEKWVKKHLQGQAELADNPIKKSTHLLDLEQKFKRSIGTNVTIQTKKNGERGKITIDFYSLDDFDRISQMFGVDALASE
jgi:ParB family chromosome partitioning protein